MYRILTNRGYYFTVHNGRYGRIDGQRSQAEALCDEHAALCVRLLKPYGVFPAAISIPPAQTTTCAACERLARRKDDE